MPRESLARTAPRNPRPTARHVLTGSPMRRVQIRAKPGHQIGTKTGTTVVANTLRQEKSESIAEPKTPPVAGT